MFYQCFICSQNLSADPLPETATFHASVRRRTGQPAGCPELRRPALPSLSLATIYKTLDTLAQLLIVRRWFRASVGGGESRQRMVFVMRHYNELQFNEISEAMKISVGTAKSLHFKAVQNLKKWLTPYLGVTT